MKKLKAVIIGTGSISKVHAAGIKESSDIELTACWNRPEDENPGRIFERQHGAKYFSDLDKMLETEKPDIAISALPPKYRMIGLEKAAEIGAHLVLEKPMALSVEECRRLKELADKSGTGISVTESSAFDKTLRSASSNRMTIGNPLHLLSTNYRKYFSPERSSWISSPEECPGGMILNVGVHRVAAMRILAGSLEKRITAMVNSRPPEIPVKGDCSARIEYESGAIGTLLMCGYFDCGKLKPNLQQMTTDKGLLRIEGKTAVFSNAEGETEELPLDDELSTLQYANFYKELELALKAGSVFPYTADEGMRDVAVIEAAMLSSQEKRTVDMDEVL
jgi:predicted dehydrogenase